MLIHSLLREQHPANVSHEVKKHIVHKSIIPVHPPLARQLSNPSLIAPPTLSSTSTTTTAASTYASVYAGNAGGTGDGSLRQELDLQQILNAAGPIDASLLAIPSWTPARFSSKKNGEVEGYAAGTHEGLIRYGI